VRGAKKVPAVEWKVLRTGGRYGSKTAVGEGSGGDNKVWSDDLWGILAPSMRRQWLRAVRLGRARTYKVQPIQNRADDAVRHEEKHKQRDECAGST
jgi:hypothetical protein